MSTKLRIRTAQELLEALAASDIALIAAVHKTIVRDPDRALAFGKHGDQDVVDFLIATATGRRDTLSLLTCHTLSVFDDPRVVQFFIHQLHQARGAHLDGAVAYLLSHRHQFSRAALYDALMQNTSLHRVRGAARLLEEAAAEDPGEVTLRLALLRPEADLPRPDDTTQPLWRAELDGVLSAEARAALTTFGRPVFEWLNELRGTLPFPTRQWLLDWGAKCWPQRVVSALREAMEDAAGVEAALSCLESTPSMVEAVGPELDRIFATAPRRSRIRALRLGARGDWPNLLASETDGEMRAFYLLAWGAAAPLETLIAGLHEPDWRVRAAACELLPARGEAAAEALRPLLNDASTPVRAAAVQVLSALGHIDWIEESLLVP